MAEPITLHGGTKLSDLLTAYPWLKEALIGISEKFHLLNTPLGKVMVKKATISEMSKRSGFEEAFLIEKLQSLIAAHSAG